MWQNSSLMMTDWIVYVTLKIVYYVMHNHTLCMEPFNEHVAVGKSYATLCADIKSNSRILFTIDSNWGLPRQ